MIVWMTLVAMAAVTFATRALPMLALRGEMPYWLHRWLALVPAAVFTALALPPLLVQRTPTVQFVVGPQLVAALVGGIVAWYSRNVLATILVGMAAFWLLKLVWQ